MSLTDQQFRKLLAKGIKERKAYERAFRSANLLKEGYAPYNEENEAGGCPIEGPDRHDQPHDRTSAGEGRSKAAWDYNGEWANYLMYLEDEQEIYMDSELFTGRFEIYLPVIDPPEGSDADMKGEEPDASQLRPYICLDNKQFNSIVDMVNHLIKIYGYEGRPLFKQWAEAALARASERSTMLGTNESKALTEVQEPIQAAIDELINLLNQTSNGDYRSQIENIIRILNPDVGGTAEPYQLQPVEI